ncbi:hypothetical protein B2J93_9235 [Marssonina coronariae]|uniref:Uncharacterized protein n=1 Tax=Diplocarpon coronariae TaxID=2795749 RepID=A0A218ZFC8_9HELO|nr:hypothetical protein B2J93_9235 [Marssonina coronariae]
MVPLSSASAMPWAELAHRGLGDSNHTGSASSLTSAQKNTLKSLAVTFSAISVASSVLTFYWFLKMRRSFRHDLIMLLIQSDMFKALGFMVYPIVVFVYGPVQDASTFCQINGFMTALGIEASDFAVLMIAIHSALYIFRPRSSGSEGGLYPYRRLAYILWIVFPVLMASLAFLNHRHAYVSEGTYCYLPVRPFWYRLALDWIPRYIIFLIILAIYASIYFYVGYKFKDFERLTNRAPGNDRDSRWSLEKWPKNSRGRERATVPPTPHLTCHGLLPGARRDALTETVARKPSVSTMDSYISQPIFPPPGPHRFMWRSFSAPDNPSPTPLSEGSLAEEDSFEGPSAPRPLPPTFALPISPPDESDLSEMASRATSWRDNFVHRFSPHNASNDTAAKRSVVDIFAVLRRHPDRSSTSTAVSRLRLTNSRGQTVADAELARTRDKIHRQLRFLFIYPLVYIGMWILPFVSHGLQYSDRFAIDPPFAITCCTTISICMQAAVDAWLFSTREKPWRHIPGTDGGFWVSFKFWSDWTGFRKRRVRQGPGRTRDEAVREARAAYWRRDEELAQRRYEADRGTGTGQRDSARKERSEWWESIAVDGTISPVGEEGANPMEEVILFDEEVFADKGTCETDGGASDERRRESA